LRSSSIEYFKNIVDALNVDHIAADNCLSTEESIEIQKLGRELARVTFYDSIVVIEKLSREKKRPYRHLLSGQQANVNDPASFIATAPTELIEPWLLGETTARSIDLALKDKLAQSQREIEALRKNFRLLETEAAKSKESAAELEEQRTRVAALENDQRRTLVQLAAARADADAQSTRNKALEEALRTALASLARARSDINALLNSRSWRATSVLRRVTNLFRRSP